jgi:outer membrane lipoprotein carrier protein
VLAAERACARAVLLLILLVSPHAWSATDPGLVQLQNFLDALDTLTAEFSQEVVNRDEVLVEAASGVVALQKPGRFRWDYRTPFERVIVADGERVWLYEADLDQVTVRLLDEGLGETPAALLTGAVDVLDRFEFRGSETIDGRLWVDLGPRSAAGDFEQVRLGFDGGELTRLELRDRLGQTTRLAFTAVEQGAALPDGVFTFDVPDGVDVIGEDEL